MHASMQHSTKSLNLIKFKVFVSLSAATIVYTIKINVGSNVHLPCHFPPSSQVSANALWFKEMGAGITTRLTLGDSSTEMMRKLNSFIQWTMINPSYSDTLRWRMLELTIVNLLRGRS